VDVSLGTFVKVEERTAREKISKAELIRGFIGDWLQDKDFEARKKKGERKGK